MSDLLKSELPYKIYSREVNQKFYIYNTFKSILKDFPAAHSLGFRFAKRNITSRYRQSALGILWAILPPLATAVIWIALFKSKIIKIETPGVPYPLFVICGTVLWSVFSNSVLMPIQSIQSNRGILTKINFPREALLVNAFYEILFNALISILILLLALLIYRVDLSPVSLLFFPMILGLIILGMGIGIILAPFSFLYKDIQFALPSLLQFLMYLTPVVYMKPTYTGSAKILEYNPVSPLLTNARAWLLNLDSSYTWEIFIVGAFAFFLLLLAIFIQKITMQIIIERMGS